MKKIILGLLAGCLITAASVTQTKAQVSVSLNVGIWNPPAEYEGVDYYYLPDVDSYYYVPTHQYVYLLGDEWVFRNTLPPRYSYYNINNGYKIAVNRSRPYLYHRYDRNRYARYRGSHNRQVIVRDHYRTRPINHTRVVNRNHYVNRPNHARVINRTRVVNRPNHARVTTHTRIANRPNHTRVTSHTRAMQRNASHSRPQAPHHNNGGGHNKHH